MYSALGALPLRRSQGANLLLGVLLAPGCTDLTAPESLDGSWGEVFEYAGSGLSGVTFTLVTSGDVISGSGTWTGEACCGGSETIYGTEVGGSVSLDFAFITQGSSNPPRTAQFMGKMTGKNTIVGTFGTDPTATGVVFLRTN